MILVPALHYILNGYSPTDTDKPCQVKTGTLFGMHQTRGQVSYFQIICFNLLSSGPLSTSGNERNAI